MKIKDWLNRGRECEGMIEALEWEKEKCRKLLFSDYHGDDYRIILQEYIDYEDKINKEIDKLIDIKREIFEVIRRMPMGRHRQVLQLRYLCMVDTWEHIADKTNYELSWLQRGLHSQALDMAEKIYQKLNDKI